MPRKPKSKPREQATELEYLRWFYVNADFGPADSEVRAHLEDRFQEESGRMLPAGYESGES